MSDKVVYTKPVDVHESDLLVAIGILNDSTLDIDPEEGDVPLTLEEVYSKPALLEFFCEVLLTCDGEDDIHEAWNFDEFSDFKKFR